MEIFDWFKRKLPWVKREDVEERVLYLDKGDSVLVLKANGKSLLLKSDLEDGSMSSSDELLFILSLYIANPEYVQVLYSLFDEILEQTKAELENEKKSNLVKGEYVTPLD